MQTASGELKSQIPDGASTQLFATRFEAENMATRAALSEIRAAMEREGLEMALIARVEIALAELFNNIAEHAYCDTGEGEVRCTMGMSEQAVIVEVTDQGGPMPGGEMPKGILPDIDVDFADLPEGGFGWFLIRTQTDGLSHKRLAMGNFTRLNFDLERDSTG